MTLVIWAVLLRNCVGKRKLSLLHYAVSTLLISILSNKGVLPFCIDKRPFGRRAKISQFGLIN